MAENQAIVIDCGSGKMKVGFAGDDAPRTDFPTIVGTLKQQFQAKLAGNKQWYIGDEAQSKLGTLNVVYPLQHGVCQQWDHMERLWHNAFYNELRVSPEEQPVLLNEALQVPKVQKEKTTQIMFETFGVPAMQISTSAKLSLFADGRITGTVLESGFGVTESVSIYEGQILENTDNGVKVAGMDLTNYMMKLLEESGHSFTTTAERVIVEDIKKKLCYTAFDYQTELQKSYESSALEKTYELPDGNIITINRARFTCAEALFQPTMIFKDAENAFGIQDAIVNAIGKSPIDIRRELYSSIVLCGGNTMFDGIAERLVKELTCLAPASVKINVRAEPNRKYLAWIGGSILGSLATFQSMWITKEEYDDIGAGIIHSKMC